MDIKVVGSGSTGNTYLLKNKTETLVIDCGVRFFEIKKALGFDISTIKGAVVTHQHGDHAKYAHEYENAGIAVWKPYTMENLRQAATFGGFKVQSFEAIHDVPCVGYLIEHEDIGKMLYVTDSEYVKYTFRGLNVMLIEANYDNRYIDMDDPKTRHVLTGHMSLQTCMECIKANSNPDLNHVILCHLSADNAYAEGFQNSVKEIVPAGCTVSVAKRGLTVGLGEIPF